MAVRGRGREQDPVVRGLALFSLALGAAQVAAPRRLARLIGVEPGHGPGVVRAVGVRELATGIGILAQPRAARWLWARVAGDAVDLALLATADGRRRDRIAAAMTAVAGVAVPDLVEGARLSRSNGSAAVDVRKSVTVRKPPDEVYAFWRELENLPRFMAHLESVETTGEGRSRWRAKGPAGQSVEWEAELVDNRPGELIAWRSLDGADVESSGAVRFAPAPGDRGTEVRVELSYAPPAGRLGAAAAKLLGEEPATQLADDLRRFKQVLETGEIARSDGNPRGHELAQQLSRRPAQPSGGEAA